MRRVLSAAVLTCLAAALLLPAAADATSGNTGFGVGGNSGTSYSSGGYAGGQVKWYELRNMNRTPRWHNLFNDLRERFNRRALFAASRQATNSIMKPCERSLSNPRCILWRNSPVRKTGSGAVRTWWEVHTAQPEKVAQVTSGNLVGFNIRIWRENPARKRFDLIFERRVGIGKMRDADPNVPGKSAGSDPNFQRRWWYGGTTANQNGGGAQNGGSFAVRGRTSAGMLGNFNSFSKEKCRENYSRGKNGKRKRQVDGKRRRIPSFARPSKSKLKALNRAGWNWCYWEGEDIGPKAFRWARVPVGGTTAPPRNDPAGVRQLQKMWGRNPSMTRGERRMEFGQAQPKVKKRKVNRRVRQNSAQTAGLKEAIWIQWKAPFGRGEKGVNRIRYKIDGAPGLFYVVQIVGIDRVEKIMDLQPPNLFTGDTKRTLRNTYYYRGQFVKGYIANPVQGSDTTDHDHQGGAPSAGIELNGPATLQTREHADYNASLNAAGLDERQAVLPYQVTLDHFTPQMNYSSAKLRGAPANTYPADYAVYGVLRHDGQHSVRPQTPALPQAHTQGLSYRESITGGRDPNLRMARINVPAWLAPFSDEEDLMTTYPIGEAVSPTFTLSWLQPTLESACAAQPELPFPPRSWPRSLHNCPNPAGHAPRVYNAWDDYVQARGQWESRWAQAQIASDGTEKRIRDVIPMRSIRCSAPQNTKESDCAERFHWYGLHRPQGGLPVSTQYAQGYLLLADGNDDGAADVRLRLDTNRPSKVSGVYIHERGLEPDPEDTSTDEEQESFTYIPIESKHRRDGFVRVDFCEGSNCDAPSLPVASDGTGYVVTFVFSGLTNTDLTDSAAGAEYDHAPGAANATCRFFQGNSNRPRPGTCWKLQARYEGFSSLIWHSRFENPGPSEESATYVSVYGPRADR